MTHEAIHLTDFPPFIRLELDESFRRKIFSRFVQSVGSTAVPVFPDEFWHSVEAESARSRYELIFGHARGKILKTLAERPSKTKEVLECNPDIPQYTLYHTLTWLKDHGLIHKNERLWASNNDYFTQVTIADLAKITDLRHPGLRRKNAVSMNDLEMATYLWPKYERASEQEEISVQLGSYGRWYQNHFALARAVKEWEKGTINIPQWALVAIADRIGLDLDSEERRAVASYSLPPGIKITPQYNGRYKIPIELSPDFDALALQILLKSSNDGVVHPTRYKKALLKQLHLTFGSFQSTRIPLSIRAIIMQYYQITSPCSKRSFRIPERMKERWKKLPEHEKTLAQILILEMLYDLNRSPARNSYEIISRSKPFLDDIASVLEDLGVGSITIQKRKDRPHYRSYLPKKVKANLRELKENVEASKIEKGIDFLAKTERAALIRKIKKDPGETGVSIISNLRLDTGVSDLDIARATGVKLQEVRKILYELRNRAIVTDIREEIAGHVEYYYYLCPEGIKKFLAKKRPVKTEKEEDVAYPFPDEFAYYQRRRLYSEVE
ncbi:MAG TPA: hypothetical protein VMW67_03625 [Desulfobacteria bacterium]|nr:hypothetical protein [Desulfobacteria bacterium]